MLLLVVLDKEMPRMDGHDATRTLRERGLTTPIIAVTGNALEADKDAFLASGATGFVTKPCRKAQIEEVLQRYLLNEGMDTCGGIV